MKRLHEALYDGWGQFHDVAEVLFEIRTGHQHLIIFENPVFGRVMALDGVIQTTERDEFVYHEMMTHVPLLAHGDARRVLVIGGGDGGIVREVLRHRSVEAVTMVEIDPMVVDMCARFFPGHSAGAFDDRRLELVFADGAEYVRTASEVFDVVIVDSTDPIGPGEVLFEADFYRHAHQLLSPGGVMITQNGVAFMQLDEVRNTARRMGAVFSDAWFYQASIPTYVGGLMTLGWGSDDRTLRHLDATSVEQRMQAAGLNQTRYYTPEVHVASFALPRFVIDAIG